MNPPRLATSLYFRRRRILAGTKGKFAVLFSIQIRFAAGREKEVRKSVPEFNDMGDNGYPDVEFKLLCFKKRKRHGTIKTIAIRSNLN